MCIMRVENDLLFPYYHTAIAILSIDIVCHTCASRR